MSPTSNWSLAAGFSAAVIALLSNPAQGQLERALIDFEEVGASKGILPVNVMSGMGMAVAVADIDDDGDLDMFIANNNNRRAFLYVNQNGFFVDRSATSGLDILDGSRAALWFDYDGDRDLDLLTATDFTQHGMAYHLYRQDNNLQFTDVTVEANLDYPVVFQNRGTMVVTDINNDGWLDIYAAVWNSLNHQLFQNNGDGTFTDVTAASGILTNASDTQWQVVSHDWNNDGWQDLSVAVDFDENLLWINQQDGTYVDVAAAANFDVLFNDMGQAIGDYDNDGDFDIFTTNVFENGKHSTLFRNDTVGSNVVFTELAQTEGVDDGGWGWGCVFFDANNDGWVDLYATNGFGMVPWDTDVSRFYLNKRSGPDWFTPDMAARVGLDDNLIGYGALATDIDRDGDMDLIQSTQNAVIRLLENKGETLPRTQSNHSFMVKPRMLGPNYRAIGSVVRLTTDSHEQVRLVSAGSNFMCQEPAEACFGTGTDDTVNEIRVEFPNGEVSSIGELPADQILMVAPPPLTHCMLEQGEFFGGDVLEALTIDQKLMEVTTHLNAASMVIGCNHPPVAAASTMDLTIRASTLTANVDMTASLYNYTTEQWDDLGTWTLNSHGQIVDFTGLTVSDYVDSEDRSQIRLRSGRTQALPEEYRVGVDFVGLTLN